MHDHDHMGFQMVAADNWPAVLPAFVKKTNTADERLGAKAVFATDDFFAPKQRMLRAAPAVFVINKFDEHGKWMDGWETRRKRHLGYDYVIVALARPTRLAGFDIDTSHFTGNYPTSASIEGLYAPDLTEASLDQAQWESQDWVSVLALTPLKGNSHHLVEATDAIVTHVRLNIYPDGGIARLRVYGDIVIEADVTHTDEVIDLVAALNGGRAVATNDAHFGAVEHLLLPHKAINMGEGWETRRRREPGHDWCILALGHVGIVERIEVDTAFFKGNFPDRLSVQAVYAPDVLDATAITQSLFWDTLLDEQPLSADCIHVFDQVQLHTPITHVKINIFPDGGISRIRLWGKVVSS